MQDQGAAATPAGTSSSTTTSNLPGKKRHEEKFRKKDPKSWENVSKTLANLEEEQKLSFVEEKYQELYNEFRVLYVNNQQLTKDITTLQKVNETKCSELAKNVVARARMESLCRELQKQNKEIKEENFAKIKEEEERRKEVSSRFADKLNDINAMMDENKEKSDKLREENLKMSAKFAELYDQFQKREEDITKMTRQLELERQFSQATLAKMELEMKAEKEMHLKEQTVMKNSLEKSEANCCVLLETVKGLQDHIDVYKNQYEDFESTMSKSAKVFDNFKFEIANMTKQVSALEKEALSWKNKFHECMNALVEVTEIKKNQELCVQSLDKKCNQLQKLCRTLQSERADYLTLLKTHGIKFENNTKEESVKKGESSIKMTPKEKELQILKENLKAVQDELSRLNVEESTNNTEKSDIFKTDKQTSQVTLNEKATAESESAKIVQSILEDVLQAANLETIPSQQDTSTKNDMKQDEIVSKETS